MKDRIEQLTWIYNTFDLGVTIKEASNLEGIGFMLSHSQMESLHTSQGHVAIKGSRHSPNA